MKVDSSLEQLVLYQQVGESMPGRAMARFLGAVERGGEAAAEYLALVRALYVEGPGIGASGDAWVDHLLAQILLDENPFTISCGASGQPLPAQLLEAAAHDLRLLRQWAALTGPTCREMIGAPYLPTWPGWGERRTTNPAMPRLQAMAAELLAAPDWGAMVDRLITHYRQAGVGLGGGYYYLRWDGEQLDGIAEPSMAQLDDLVGLSEAKSAVLRNTEQFLHGLPANNMLLYGSRGTGKSTMLRALPMRYGPEGLRLVEVARQAISTLPALFRTLQRSAQWYILFLDDLTFSEDEADYKAFKSMVEGALEQRPTNVVLYATSNRRHLVPERWSDRNAPEVAEVHGQDTLEEKLSLADRFGMTVYFPAPNQAEYLAIVKHLAEERGLPISPAELEAAALRWVMWNNPRSGRAARQFIDDLAGRLAVANGEP